MGNKTVANHINLYYSIAAKRTSAAFLFIGICMDLVVSVFLLNLLAAFSPQTFLDKRGIKTQETCCYSN